MSDPFPLRLTQFERFHVLDDLPAYPNNVVCHLVFDGKLNRDLWFEAVREGSPRHPMLTARLTGKRGREQWERGDSIGVECVVIESSQPGIPNLPHLDVRKGLASRIIIVDKGDHDEVLLQTHHAACDGIGGMTSIFDLMVIYHKKASDSCDPKVKLRAVDDGRLVERNRYIRNWREAVSTLPKQFVGLYGVIKYFLHRAIPLNGFEYPIEELKDPESGITPAVFTHRFNQQESANLLTAANAFKATVNAVLLRDLILAIRDWQDHHQIDRKGRKIRLMIPVNMRTIADRRLGAANRVSMVYIDRADPQMKDAGELLWGIDRELKVVQRLNLGLTGLALMRAIRWIPGLSRRELSTKKCRETALVTNLGEPFARIPLPRDEADRVVVAGTTLKHLDLVAPIRPFTHVAVSIFRYADCINFSIHFDKQALKPGKVEGLVRRFTQRIQRSIQQGLARRDKSIAGDEASEEAIASRSRFASAATETKHSEH